MKKLTLQDKRMVDEFVSLRPHGLSYFSFAAIFIWKDTFAILWEIIDGNLCIFAKDNTGCFMYLPPLGNSPSGNAARECFRIMDRHNSDPRISRIENCEQGDLDFYHSMGMRSVLKGSDYIYRTQDLVSLSGDDYKKKRSARNYFIKHYDFTCQPYDQGDSASCCALYERWAQERRRACDDPAYRQMLVDNYRTVKIALESHAQLGIEGWVVRIGGDIKGYSFGFPLNKDIYCALFEIADLSIKGLPQYLFWEFSRENRCFSYVNAMDDSGLKNLARVKLSYRPYQLEPSYIIMKN